jgi:hypothetical protein
MPSNKTGEDLVAGENNRADDTTWVIACKASSDGKKVWPTQPPVGQAERWDAILVVTPSGIVDDRPKTKLDGIVGTAHRGGAGVRGIGNQKDGLPGRDGSGSGGEGVVGQGGTGDLQKGVGIHQPPGMGVLGIGGNWTGPLAWKAQTRTNQGGAGVVGVAGGDIAGGPWVPPFEDTQGVGVYGISGVGVGVYGVSQVGDGMVAQGKENGLRAQGRFGVYAFGENIGTYSEGIAVGLHGLGQKGPGGIFERFPQLPPGKVDNVEFYEQGALPQIAIRPLPMVVPDAEEFYDAVQVIPTDEVDQLPLIASAEELLLTMKPSQRPGVGGFEEGAEAILWLCVKSSAGIAVPAVWKQVLLGPPINGQRNP